MDYISFCDINGRKRENEPLQEELLKKRLKYGIIF